MSRILTSLILCLIALCFNAAAQQTANSATQKSQWKRFVGENGEFSVALPANVDILVDPSGTTVSNPRDLFSQIHLRDLRSIRAFENGVAFLLERYQSKNAKTALSYLLAAQAVDGSYQGREAGDLEPQMKDFEVDKIIGRQSVDDNSRRFMMKLWLASDNYVYVVTIGARDKNNPSLNPFLASVRVAGKQLMSQPANSETNALENVNISDLVSTPLQVVKESRDEKSDRKNEENIAKAELTDKGKKEEKTDSNSIVSDLKPIVILSQPRPGYTEEARKNGITGKIHLRVTFSASGQIRSVSVVQRLQFGLTEKAINAARRILFLPAERQDTLISVTKIVEYRFTMY